MESNIDVICFLQIILESKDQIRIDLIRNFQDEFWNDENIKDEKLNEILSELAYDLDFYEPNEEWRKEAPNYFGDDKLEELINSAIFKLKNLDT